MKKLSFWAFVLTALIVITGCCLTTPTGAEDPTRITVAEVKERVDRAENILFLDIRSTPEWRRSEIKIPEARRVHSQEEITAVIKEISRDRLIVTYCT